MTDPPVPGDGRETRRYRTMFHPAARDELRALPRAVAMRVLTKLTRLEADPYAMSTTALVGVPGARRLRVGDLRVVYTVDGDELTVWVVHVRHRSTVYRRER